MKCCGGSDHNHDGDNHKPKFPNLCTVFMVIAIILLVITLFLR